MNQLYGRIAIIYCLIVHSSFNCPTLLGFLFLFDDIF